jgi:putative ABC transport system permease protein
MSLINSTLNKTLTYEVFSNPLMWVLLISVVIFIGTISGLLIGSNISRISPLVLLSGKTTEKSKSKKWDHSFLVFHFSIYIILVVSVITVTKQVRYSIAGYKNINPNNILVSELNSPALQSGFRSICSEIEKIPGVKQVAGSSFIPLYSDYIPITLAPPEGDKVTVEGLLMGEGMTEMLNIEIIEGRPFGDFKPAAWEVLFNESAAKKFKLKTGDHFSGVNVRGIVRDFHSHSLQTPIEPMVILQQNPLKMGLLAIKTDGTNDNSVVKRLGELYQQIAPDEILDVKYISETMNAYYSHEKNQAEIMGAFSILATVLAIMGLFGIALISIARKTKEIGLRKVNGATVLEVLYRLDRDFAGWVLLSFTVGIPASYFIMSHWQKQYAYKTELSWWIFALAGISAILVALLTVSWQSWRAATKNPVEALRYE